jgi:hypothetical protein
MGVAELDLTGQPYVTYDPLTQLQARTNAFDRSATAARSRQPKAALLDSDYSV